MDKEDDSEPTPEESYMKEMKEMKHKMEEFYEGAGKIKFKEGKKEDK